MRDDGDRHVVLRGVHDLHRRTAGGDQAPRAGEVLLTLVAGRGHDPQATIEQVRSRRRRAGDLSARHRMTTHEPNVVRPETNRLVQDVALDRRRVRDGRCAEAVRRVHHLTRGDRRRHRDDDDRGFLINKHRSSASVDGFLQGRCVGVLERNVDSRPTQRQRDGRADQAGTDDEHRTVNGRVPDRVLAHG